MNRIYLPILLFFSITYYSYGQVNLVPNGDFEQYVHCPRLPGQIDSCLYWINPVIYPGMAGADYFNPCTDYPGINVPDNYCGFQEPHSGTAYCGLALVAPSYTTNCREYIEVPLNDELKSNICYHISMQVSLGDNSKFSSNDISVYFSDTIIQGVHNYNPLPFSPQFNYSSPNLIDNVNWNLVEGDFEVNGGEKYLIIGNFKNDSLTNTTIVNPSGSPWAYVYIDDVSVIVADLGSHLLHDTIIHPNDSVYLGGQTGIGLDEDCIWFVNGQPIDTIAGMWVKPDSSTTYVLQQTICGNVKYDTVTITVSGVGVDQYTAANNSVRLFPNPATNILYIESIVNIIKADVYDLTGKLIFTKPFNKNQIDISHLATGMYFIKLTTPQGTVVKKFVKE